MIDVLENYQNLAQRFPAGLLTAPGILIVLVGLCVWLAGLRWRRVVGACVGATIAVGVVSVIDSFPVNVLLAACAVGLFAGILINRIVFGLLAAIAGVFVATLILSARISSVENEQNTVAMPDWSEYEQVDAILDAHSAQRITLDLVKYLSGRIKTTIVAFPVIAFILVSLTATIAVILALMMPVKFTAFVCSMLGSSVIFVGMIMLLFYKGSRPITYIARRQDYFGAVFVAMTLFGMLVQIVLSSPPGKLLVSQKEEKGE